MLLDIALRWTFISLIISEIESAKVVIQRKLMKPENNNSNNFFFLTFNLIKRIKYLNQHQELKMFILKLVLYEQNNMQNYRNNNNKLYAMIVSCLIQTVHISWSVIRLSSDF